jgi:hypothetical protein
MHLSSNPQIIMHLAAFIAVAALALQDQLKLRIILLLSIICNFWYHDIEPGGPSWAEIFWDAVSFGIDIWGIVRIILDKTHLGLSREEEKLFQAFGCLSPGEFRQFLKPASWRTADQSTILTEEGVMPDRLYYVLRGVIEIRKADRAFPVAPRCFIGELAFLRGTPASATVEIAAGTRYIVWPSDRLNRCFAKRPELRVAVLHLISQDMALKVARS